MAYHYISVDMLILMQESFQFCNPRLKTPQLVLPYHTQAIITQSNQKPLLNTNHTKGQNFCKKLKFSFWDVPSLTLRVDVDYGWSLSRYRALSYFKESPLIIAHSTTQALSKACLAISADAFSKMGHTNLFDI